MAIVASYTLAGGVLTGKYDQDPGAGRIGNAGESASGASGGRRDLADLAKDIGKDPANLAMAFALLTPSVTIVLFGATRPGQVVANLGALAVADALTPDEHRRLAVTGQKNRG